MAQITPDQLKTMDYACQGQPFVDVPAKSSIDLKTMDWAFKAQPFVRNFSLIYNARRYTLPLLGVG